MSLVRFCLSVCLSDFSVIIGLYSAVPMLDYDDTRTDPMLMYAHRDNNHTVFAGHLSRQASRYLGHCK